MNEQNKQEVMDAIKTADGNSNRQQLILLSGIFKCLYDINQILKKQNENS